MTYENARSLAVKEAKKLKISLAIVDEGPHADDFAEFDADGKSYGFCPVGATDLLYPHGTVIGCVLAPVGKKS